MSVPKPRFWPDANKPADIIRAELFSLERLEQHAASLAQAQQVTSKRFKGRSILTRVKSNNRALSAAHRRITQNIRDERSITPAAEWFVDNFYVIEEQILEIHDYLPPKFYQGLPKLAEGVLKGTPRVYGVAWAFVAHTDNRFSNRYPALQGGTVHGPVHPIFMAGVRTVISSRHHAI